MAADTFIGTKIIKTDKGTTCTVKASAKMLNSVTGIMTWDVTEDNGDYGVLKFKCEDMDIEDMRTEFNDALTGRTAQPRCRSIYAHFNK